MTDISLERKIILTIGAIILIVPLTAIFGQYASCKYICWAAPLMIIGTKIRDLLHLNGLHLKSELSKCNNCTVCSKKCPMNLDVMSNINKGQLYNTECILCGNCIDHCKQKAIRFSFKKNNTTA